MKKLLPPYGFLLTFDGYNATKTHCADMQLLYKLLSDLPEKLGMRPLGFPHIVSVEEKGIKGLSGFTFIIESHISIHTYEERGFVTADIYSCKQFDPNKAADYLSSTFGTRTFDTSVLIRGRRFNESQKTNAPRPHARL